MDQEVNTTFQKDFLMTSLANQLLPCCISSGVPLCYMDKALVSTRSPLGGHFSMGCPFFLSTADPLQKKWGHFPSDSFKNHQGKRTHIHSPEADIKTEPRSLWGNKTMHKLVPEAGASTKHQRTETC